MPELRFRMLGPRHPRNPGWLRFFAVGKHMHMAFCALNEVFPVGRVLQDRSRSPPACPCLRIGGGSPVQPYERRDC